MARLTLSFLVDARVQRDNVLQIKDSRDFWRVVDAEEDYQYGIATKLQVRVVKIDQSGNEIQLNASGRAVFNAPVYGGVQIGGQKNTQSVSITNTQNAEIDSAVESLD